LPDVSILSTIVLNMSIQPSPLVLLFGSKTRADVITLFIMHPDESFYVRQIAGLLHQSTTPVVRELARLEQMGLLTSENRANAKYFSMNRQSPIFSELQSLVLKTAGLADVLKKTLKSLADLSFAFVYGSFASGEMGPKSDVDLFMIGNVPLPVLTRAVRTAESKLGREVQYSIFDGEEFLRKLKKGDDFIRQVVLGHKIMIVGDISDFERFAKTGFD